jgi:hypothetical protein
MTEENPDYRTEETAPVSDTPGAEASMTTEAMAGLEAVKADPLADEATRQAAHERAMFERHVQEQGSKIPENFKSAGDWFDSLKGAQAKFTQSQQEIAALKKQYEMSGNTDNPDFVEPTPSAPEAPAVEADASTEDMIDELRIPSPEVKDEQPADEAAPTARVTEADYATWSNEIATTGKLSDETRVDLKAKTGFSDAMVNDYLSAQQAKRRAAFADAAEIVGGGEKLSKILRWSANNFSGDQLADLQRGLAGASSELTLRGLAAAYDKALPSEEPKINANAVTPATAGATRELPGYKSMQEYRMDMSNPRFQRDDAFRRAVEMRAARTDWRTMG